MPIEGPLQDIGIHDLFQLLDLARKSGSLRVQSQARDNEGIVYFDAGAVVHATMRNNPHRLGNLLRKAGRVSDQQLRDVAAAQLAGDKRKIGEILVAQGAITRREIERYIRQQIETVVFELFSWKEGTFSFSESEPGDQLGGGGTRVTAAALLMEGARRIDEWSRVADSLPDPAIVPRLVALSDAPESAIDLRPAEWEILSLVDGARSMRDIAAELAVSEFEVARTLYGMFSAGLLEPRRSEAALHE